MIYKGTSTSESLWFQSEETSIMYRIIMTKSATEIDTFSVTCGHNDGWAFTFKTTNASDYERVKWSIMELLGKRDTDGNSIFSDSYFLTALGNMFKDEFEFILDISAE